LLTIGAIYVRNLHTPRFVFYAVGISFVWMAYFAFVSCSSGPLQLLGLKIVLAEKSAESCTKPRKFSG